MGIQSLIGAPVMLPTAAAFWPTTASTEATDAGEDERLGVAHGHQEGGGEVLLEGADGVEQGRRCLRPASTLTWISESSFGLGSEITSVVAEQPGEGDGVLVCGSGRTR